MMVRSDSARGERSTAGYKSSLQCCWVLVCPDHSLQWHCSARPMLGSMSDHGAVQLLPLSSHCMKNKQTNPETLWSFYFLASASWLVNAFQSTVEEIPFWDCPWCREGAQPAYGPWGSAYVLLLKSAPDAGLSFLSVTQQPMNALLAPPRMQAELCTTSAFLQHLSSPFGHSF